MPTEMPEPLSEIMRDDTLTPGDRLRLIEALFVHDAVGQWREGPADVGRDLERSNPALSHC